MKSGAKLVINFYIYKFIDKIMKRLNVLIACEESQTECLAFRALGHNAFSCDIQECSGGFPEYHIQADVRSLINCPSPILFITSNGDYHTVPEWDLIIAHPPCTYMSAANPSLMFPNGNGIPDPIRLAKAKEAAAFFRSFLQCNCSYVAVENPRPLRICCLPSPDDVVYPFEFGEPYSKRTYLWLKNLPPLIGTCFVSEFRSWTLLHSSPKFRSKSFNGIAAAMASQWSAFVLMDKYNILNNYE